MIPPPPRSTLFPYTTLFRSVKTLDVAKRLLDEGLHPPTIYFPLIVEDRKSTRLNSSHVKISYAVFCLKKKKQRQWEKEQQKHNTGEGYISGLRRVGSNTCSL